MIAEGIAFNSRTFHWLALFRCDQTLWPVQASWLHLVGYLGEGSQGNQEEVGPSPPCPPLLA